MQSKEVARLLEQGVASLMLISVDFDRACCEL